MGGNKLNFTMTDIKATEVLQQYMWHARKRKTTQAGTLCTTFASVVVCDGLVSPYSWTSGYWELGVKRLKLQFLSSQPNQWFLGRSQCLQEGSLRSFSCTLLTQLQAHRGASCWPPALRRRDNEQAIPPLNKATAPTHPPIPSLLQAFSSMSVLHNKKMALWKGLGFVFLLLAQKLFSNTSNQNFHP